jgi:hypothetical protein
MRLKQALLALCLGLLPFVAWGQTPATFAPNSPLGSAALNAAFGVKADAANPVITGSLTLGGTGPITGFGTAIGQAPIWINHNGSGFPGLHPTSRLIIEDQVPTATDFATLQMNRTTAFSGGSLANTNSIIRLLGTYGAGDKTSNTLIAATGATSGTAGGQGIAGQFQMVRNAGATDNIWGLISDTIDKTGLGTSAAVVANQASAEIDLEANGPDDATNANTFGGVGVRKGIHMVAFRWNNANTTQTEISNGIWFSTGNLTAGFPTDAFTNYQSAIGFTTNTQIRNALDTRGAITPAGSANPVSAVTMTAGHVVDFNGPPTITAAPRNTLTFDSGSGKLFYAVAGVNKWSVDASGNIRAAGTLTGSVTP